MNALLEEMNEGTTLQALTYIWEGGIRKTLGLKETDLEAALSIANLKMKAGEFELAYRIYSSLTLCDPSNFRYHQGFANFCLHTGKYSEAIYAASSMIALNQESPIGYYISAAACFALGFHDEAEEDAQDCHRLTEAQHNVELKESCEKLLQNIALARRGKA